MNRRKAVAWVGFAAFIIAWFLPTIHDVKDGDNHGGDGTGLSAFLFALVGLWDPTPPGNWPLALLGGCSALTNVLMVIVLAAVALSIDLRPRWAWCLFIAGILNASWIFTLHLFTQSDSYSLSVGYYSWWLSFFIMGSALLMSRPVGR